ncbi:hypothetical protein [Fodinibius sp. Rm-B-1B1-1]|uniref:hypothetical protein n=1 Tax=Fodinibius alkaliphilus TaxID=3140241 RepID=UPI003159A62A
MVKHVFISILFLIGFFATPSYGQNTAQATMRVSVTVVSGASVEAKMSPIVWFSGRHNAEIGAINLQGIEKGEALIKSSDQIVLTDGSGHQVKMDIVSREQGQLGKNSIQFVGKKSSEMMSSVYRGEMTTSIEYF